MALEPPYRLRKRVAAIGAHTMSVTSPIMGTSSLDDPTISMARQIANLEKSGFRIRICWFDWAAGGGAGVRLSPSIVEMKAALCESAPKPTRARAWPTKTETSRVCIDAQKELETTTGSIELPSKIGSEGSITWRAVGFLVRERVCWKQSEHKTDCKRIRATIHGRFMMRWNTSHA